ncbi:MAG: phospho-sugar mutase [Oscillospiraceae bacterium]|nr:phospho-sugar mutase [Oscillospiraceae bacterium]
MTEMELYKRWSSMELEDPDLTKELKDIQNAPEEIHDRFYRELEFGTAGLRGVIGAGVNRMNIYTVRRATQGLADYVNEKYQQPKVAIAYDSRIKSDLFARESAAVLAANGIHVYLYSELMPTPMLSFAVRELHCQSGIVVTASHNPSKYNGYKVYGDDGCQMTSESANAVLEKINHVDIFTGVKHKPFEDCLKEGSVEYISQEVIDSFLDHVMALQVNPEAARKAGLKVVYTPLNGTGNKPVRKILSRMGIDTVAVVPEQENPDGNFPTCPYPNPEIRQALEKGIELCEKLSYDMLLATDPDADRVGIAVKHEGKYVLLTGNEVGALLLDYIARNRQEKGTMPNNPITVKTIVTTKLIDAIAKSYGVEVVNVLTGFKYIGEQILRLEQKGEKERYIFGFEESYGYLSGTHVRDKDAVNGSMLICEMASYYKLQGKTLVTALNELYEKHGQFIDTQQSFAFEGSEGMVKMQNIMDGLRKNGIASVAGKKVIATADYQTSVRKDANGEQTIHLPKSNVLEYGLEGGASVIVRPSGTEPKIKIYYSILGNTRAEAQTLLEAIKQDMGKYME